MDSSQGLSQDDLNSSRESSYEVLEPASLGSCSSRTDICNSDEEDKEEIQSICSSASRAEIKNKFHGILGARPQETWRSIGSYRLECRLQDFEEIEAKSRSRNACTDLGATILEDIASKNATTQTSRTDTQCVAIGTETDDSTTSRDETQTISPDQGENTETKTPPISSIILKARECTSEELRLSIQPMDSTGVSTETITTCDETQAPVTRAELVDNSSKTVEETKKDLLISHISDMDPRDLEITFLSVTNKTLQMKIERLEKELTIARFATVNENLSLDRCSMQRNIDDYMKKAEELNNCFVSTHARYGEEQTIVEQCANIVKILESSKSTDNRPLTEKEYSKILTNHRINLTSVHIQIMEDRQKMINAERQFQKILSDYKHLVLDLDFLKLENDKLNKSLKNQVESREEEYEAIKIENTFLKSRFDKVQMDLDYFRRSTR